MSFNLRKEDFHYVLPDEYIAHYPLEQCDQSKLLVYKNNQCTHDQFVHISDYLPKNAILFFNDTQVIPARLSFYTELQSPIEVLLDQPIYPPSFEEAMMGLSPSKWICIIGNLKKWKEGQTLTKTSNGCTLQATLGSYSNKLVLFQWERGTWQDMLDEFGQVPIPPYLNRATEHIDQMRYQTYYAKVPGAVAAPTAGLHFSPLVLNSLKASGVDCEYLTLHVGAGTFLPLRVSAVVDHQMHAEQMVVKRTTLERLLLERPVVAVGTTSLRTIESLYWYGCMLRKDKQAPWVVHQDVPYTVDELTVRESLEEVMHKMDKDRHDVIKGKTFLYIRPGYRFKLIDGLITNFHQPSSSLLVLVAAFIGFSAWHKVYREAIDNQYRFLSYGDSSLLYPKHKE